MSSLPAWIHSLKPTCLVYCHTAIQHHSITYNINDQSLLGSGIYGYSSYMWIVTVFFSWNCLSFMSMERNYLILVLRYIFISHFIFSSVIFKTTVEVYVCIHLPKGNSRPSDHKKWTTPLGFQQNLVHTYLIRSY